jgi:hypothetical protein
VNRTSYSVNDQLADFFRRHAGEWLTMEQLAAVAGIGGWRTRLNELVRGGMVIEKRPRRVWIEARGKTVTVVDRRYVPEAGEAQPTPTSGHDLNVAPEGRLL